MNDERPIEKLLRRYAKKRRDEVGVSPELHSATRRLLQGEVARQYPKGSSRTDKPSATGWFTLLIQRWSVALGVLVVLGIAAVVLLPSFKSGNENEFLAQKKLSDDTTVRESRETVAAPVAATPPAESQTSTLTLADSPRNQPVSDPAGGGNFIRRRDESAALSFAVTNSAADGSVSRFADARADADLVREAEEAKRFSRAVSPGSPPPANRTLTTQSRARSAGAPIVTDSLSVAKPMQESLGAPTPTERYNEARQAATPLPAPATVLSPAPATAPLSVSTTALDKNILARGGGLEKDTERFYSQSFANTASEPLREKADAPSTAVLTKFQVQQVGNQVRVIDGDGSTYLGVLNASFAGGSNASNVGERESAAYRFGNSTPTAAQALAGNVGAAQPSTQNYSWRVEGTNLTLNQNVVFTWNFVPTTSNVATLQFKTASGAANQETMTLPLQFPALLNNSTINGRAQLGPAQQIEINAVPVR
ncbi:MAG TPA: hypothetical protein VFZ59_09730 [Verrucomicrobiae bacterium]|nr:hypothetical protein [Verrucomicrobiae bacterium]